MSIKHLIVTTALITASIAGFSQQNTTLVPDSISSDSIATDSNTVKGPISNFYTPDGRFKKSPEKARIQPVEKLEDWIKVEPEITAYLEKTIVYPKSLASIGMQGTVIAQVIVKGDKIVRYTTMKEIGGYSEEAAEKGIKSIPKSLLNKLNPSQEDGVMLYFAVKYVFVDDNEPGVVIILPKK